LKFFASFVVLQKYAARTVMAKRLHRGTSYFGLPFSYYSSGTALQVKIMQYKPSVAIIDKTILAQGDFLSNRR
jgi:hypothetical protein